ncbi:GNAT family N-acetyltransferase [Paenibacillus larvae]
MHVRSFQLSDYHSVTVLLQNCLSEDCFDETIKAFAKQLHWDGELVLVAEEQEEVIGLIIGTIDNYNGYYYRVAVEPSHRRKGVGKLLIESMRQRFLQRHVHKIIVNVDQFNERILPVYESAGYSASDFSRANGLSILKQASM